MTDVFSWKMKLYLLIKHSFFTFGIFMERNSFLSYDIYFGVLLLEFAAKIRAQVILLEAKGKVNMRFRIGVREMVYEISSGSEQEKWNSGDAREATLGSCLPQKQVT